MKDVVPTSQNGKGYKRINLFANVFFSLIFAGFIGSNIYEQIRIEELYDALNMSFQSVKEVEYGTKDVDTKSFVEKVENGNLVEYTKELDTSKVGTQTLTYEVSKDDVTKDFLINVEVKDTKKPVISIKKSTITLYKGNGYTFTDNIESVTDVVDGNIGYVESVPETNENGYYVVSSDFNKNATGTYTVNIKAVDKNNNEENASYTIKVIEKPKPKVVRTVQYTAPTYNSSTYNGPSSVNTSSVSNAALSLVGHRYVRNSANPSVGFDCSGLVHYVYSLFGYNLPRTTGGLRYVGYEVSEGNMQPGDIIVWSDNGYSATHVSIYVGGGSMVHAANGRMGVVLHSVDYWKGGGRNRIISIRRV